MSVFKPGLFLGKTALVTGGGSGIGKGIATELLSLGCKVIIASRDLEKLKRAADGLSKIGEVEPMQCNIRDEDQVRETVSSVLSKHKKLDFLVNNGGGQFPTASADMKLKGWNAVIETNLTGTYVVSREAYNQHFCEHGGAVVNIIADMFRGFPYMSHTGAARAAVENLTRSLSIEWAEKGVRVNAVAPGVVYSKTAADNYAVDVFDMYKPEIPAKRFGTVEEVSSAVCFLLSPGASFISGATLRVDSGSSLYGRLMWPIEEHDKLPAYKWQDDASSKSKS